MDDLKLQGERSMNNLRMVSNDEMSLKEKHRAPTAGCLRFGPIDKIFYVFGDLSVREKDWRSRARGAKAT
jgi:hypothetical protein